MCKSAAAALACCNNHCACPAATWLKVKVQSPSSSCFVHADRTTREGPVRLHQLFYFFTFL